MGVIARDKNQITIIFSGNTQMGKKVLAYAQALEGKMLAIDISKTKVADTQWIEIAQAMDVSLGDLLDKGVIEAEDTNEFTTDDWLKIIQKNDRVLSKPVVIKGNETKQFSQTTQIFNYFGVDSAGLEKTFHTEDPTIKATTNNETFK